MRKILLASAALIALAPFTAQAEMEVTVGGYTSFQAGLMDNDVANHTSRDFLSESEIEVHADGKADNGLEYGVLIQLDASTSDTNNAGKNMLYVSGGWGRVEMGDFLGASNLVVFAPTVGIGQINGSYDDFLPGTGARSAVGHAANNRGDHQFTATDSDFSTKITYYTPQFAGFQAGISYAPELNNLGENVMFTKTANGRNMVELGLAYEGTFSGIGVKAGGNYTFADALATNEEVNAWSAGAQLSYNGFTFGGGYTDNGDSLELVGTADDKTTGWNLGATYENGPWGVGVSYLAMDYGTNGSFVNAITTAGGTYNALVLGGVYTVAPGLTTGADLALFDRNAPGSTNDDSGYAAVIDVTAAF